ncbi:MAG: hypothetical protein MUO60_01755 [Clostridiaceae bacterium]|nr:hypothetical protein [Clostridiaceae bacterium]
MKQITLLDEISKAIGTEHYKLFHIWTTQIIFSWRWWLLVILAILPWIVWIKIRDKKDTARLLLVGLVVMLVTGTLDTIGLAYNAWHYDWHMFPNTNVFLPWDYSLFPVGVMLILQFKPQINKYIKALAFAFFTAFVFTQPFIWLSVYDRQSWKPWYSFVIYIPLYLFFNYVYESNLFGINNNTIH